MNLILMNKKIILSKLLMILNLHREEVKYEIKKIILVHLLMVNIISKNNRFNQKNNKKI